MEYLDYYLRFSNWWFAICFVEFALRWGFSSFHEAAGKPNWGLPVISLIGIYLHPEDLINHLFQFLLLFLFIISKFSLLYKGRKKSAVTIKSKN